MNNYQARFLECIQMFLDNLQFATCLSESLMGVDNDIKFLTVRHELNYNDWILYSDENAHVELQLLEFQLSTLYLLRDNLVFRIDCDHTESPILKSVARRLTYPFNTKYLASLRFKHAIRWQ